MMLPNLIIPGAQKSGTSSICAYLGAHPDCCLSEPKEPSFFSRQENMNRLAEYQRFFPCSGAERMPPKILADGTTSYLAEEYVPERIRKHLGADVRFVFVLRNPAQRTMSAYWHLVKRFDEKRPISEVFDGLAEELHQAAVQEEARLAIAQADNRIRLARYRDRYDDCLWPFRYIRNSCYSEAIKRFETRFKKENMFFVILEDFIRRPAEVYRNIERFLGIDETFIPDNLARTYNKTLLPRTGGLYPALHHLAMSATGTLLRKKIRVLDRLYRDRAFREKKDFPDSVSAALQRIFSCETELLSEYLDTDLKELGW